MGGYFPQECANGSCNGFKVDGVEVLIQGLEMGLGSGPTDSFQPFRRRRLPYQTYSSVSVTENAVKSLFFLLS